MRISIVPIGCILLLLNVSSSQIAAQEDPPASATNPTEAQSPAQAPVAALTGQQLDEFIATEFKRLDDRSFHGRQLASSRLMQYPTEVVEAIRQNITSSSVNQASAMIQLLDRFATKKDLDTSTQAYTLLAELAKLKSTSIGSMAHRSIVAIEDAKEVQAFEMLTHAGLEIGYLRISINGTNPDNDSSSTALRYRSGDFTGKRELLGYLRFLRNISIVVLEGAEVDRDLLLRIVELPNVKKVLIANATLNAQDLRVLASISELKHLELAYVPVNDELVEVLNDLALTESLWLFGTKVTAEGEKKIREQLAGLEIYRGAGGFVGIQSSPFGPVRVSKIEPNSGAEKGGVQPNDIITEVDGVEVKDFDAFRAEIGKHGPGVKIRLKILRLIYNPGLNRNDPIQYELVIELGEKPIRAGN